MTTWNTGPGYYPPQDPNQGYYGGQPGGYPPQQPYPGAAPPGGYPGGMPSQGGYPGGMPPQGGYPGGYPAGGYPPGPPGAAFIPPPPYIHNPGGDMPQQPGKHENTPLSTDSAQHGDDSADMDAEAMNTKNFDFSDKSIRRGFIRKVYAILLTQLLITSIFIATFLYHEPTKHYVQTHQEMFWIALAMVLVTIIVMCCCESVRRKSPQNFIFLALFTLAESYMLGTATSFYSAEEVLMAVGITAVVCLSLTLFAFQTRWDFTIMGGILFIGLIILIVFGIVVIFIPGKVMNMLYSSLGALLFSVYLIYDTQMMMGGKHKYSVSPEEYIFAALNLYLDIINILIYVLKIIGESKK